jgi:hypothetical protein
MSTFTDAAAGADHIKKQAAQAAMRSVPDIRKIPSQQHVVVQARSL